jgi:transposase-like protein
MAFTVVVVMPAAVATDGWRGYLGLPDAGYGHEPVNLSASWGDAALRLPAIHLVFSLAKRWLMGTHHGAVSKKHLAAYLDEFVFRFNRRRTPHAAFDRLLGLGLTLEPATY